MKGYKHPNKMYWIKLHSGYQRVRFYINSAKYQPLKGSLHCQLPKKLRNAAKGLINIKNDDNECFRWCHTSHLKPQEKNPQRIKILINHLLANLITQVLVFR